MNTLLKKLRLRWLAAIKTLPYSLEYTERLYSIYLNHNKIIHFRDGNPVYSLSTPAVYSKPAANMFARSVFSAIQQRPIPNLLSFAVNDVCNVQCYHCSFFGGGVAEKGRHVMTTDEAKKALRDAQKLGVSVINIVGGEPTLRTDLAEILGAIDKDLSTVVMFTNGMLLDRVAASLRAAGLDSVYISLDAADPDEHDRRRGSKGLFAKALHGLAVAKATGMSVGISYSITPDDFAKGELQKMIELGRKIGVHEIVIFDVMPSGRMQDHDELVDNESWIDDMIAATEPYNKDSRYPGILPFAYATSYQSTGCSCGVSYFYISPYGDVNPCDFNHKNMGNLLEQPLWKIWDAFRTNDDYRVAKWGGCKIKDSAFRAREPEAAGNPATLLHDESCFHPTKELVRTPVVKERVQ